MGKDCFSSVYEAMDYFMPVRIMGYYYKVDEGYRNIYTRWVFWSSNPVENSVAHFSIEERIRRVLITLPKSYYRYTIVQFWAVERNADNRCILTTSTQPFSMEGLTKCYYSYRKECMRRTIDVGPEANEAQLGSSGRAFKNRSVEFSPDIRLYSIEEFALRDHAILCGLECLGSFPVFELDRNNIVGVLELLFEPCVEYQLNHQLAIINFKEVGLRIHYNGSPDVVDRENYSDYMAEEVHKMFKEVAKTPPLALGLAGIPCGKEHCLICSGEGCLDKLIAVYRDPHMLSLYGLSFPVTLSCSCGVDSCDPECYFDDAGKVVEFFYPIKLSYEARSKSSLREGSSDDDDDDENDDAFVFWRNDGNFDVVDNLIKHVFQCVDRYVGGMSLVQFWAPRRVAGRYFLTTSDHPFSNPKVTAKVTCLYRKECMRRNIYVDGEGNNEERLGPAGRAFKTGVVESSPDVKLYTVKEFPLRDHAVLWGIEKAMFLPVVELHGRGTVGVIEILFDMIFGLSTYLNQLTMELKEMGLRIDYVHPSQGQSDSQIEIAKIFEAVAVRHPLQLARALTPFLTDCSHKDSSLRYISHIWLLKKDPMDHYLMACNFHQSIDKYGLAEKALASRRSCFSMDIDNWGIAEYPLSQYAKLYGCNFSVAICVETTQLVETPYVLEFFLLPGDYSNENLGGLFYSLFETLKALLAPNFKYLSEHVPGEPFFFEIGKNLENGKNDLIASTSVIEGENIYEMTQATTLKIQRENIYDMPVADGIEATPPVPQGESICSPKPSTSHMKRKKGKKLHISWEDIKLHFGKTLEETANHFGVHKSTIKRRCRENGVEMWPSHEKNLDNPSLFMNQTLNAAPHIVEDTTLGSSEADSARPVLPTETCIHSTHDLHTVRHQAVSYRDSEVPKIVTIKASYGQGAFIKFKLNERSTLQDLQEQVTKRLKWDANRFEIKYQDEFKDWITIIIDEDLKDCLQASIDRCESTISMTINLKLG